ncbi:hypothetical protein JCM10212_000043 [Sporobolomyces blumeae]
MSSVGEPTRYPPARASYSSDARRSRASSLDSTRDVDLDSATSTLLPNTPEPERYSDDTLEGEDTNAIEKGRRRGSLSQLTSSDSYSPRPRRTTCLAKTSTWVTISALLLLLLVLGGGATAHPKTREFLVPSSQLHFEPNSVEWATTPTRSPSSRTDGQHNATIVILVNPFSNFYQALLPTLTNIEERFNRRLGYPIQLLTDGQLPPQAVMDRTAWITSGKATWSLVTESQGWGPPEWITQEQIDKSTKEIGFSVGYRNMCRFYSMFHFDHPAVKPYEYIWRLDEGINFHCQLMEDPIELMKRDKAQYGFSQIEIEAPFVIPTLWETTLSFLEESKAKEKGWIPDRNWQELISEDGLKTYSRKMFYNNFEIVHRSFFGSEPYQEYVKYLDKAGGFYTERWGDAPIRTIATALFLERREFHDFSGMTGYQHDNPAFVCPDKPWCDCNPDKSLQNWNGNWKAKV